MKAIAMYLPQFYEVEENNRWWGKGYTDWCAARQAEKLFATHNQPRQPLNNNYYDLSEKTTMEWQANLMKLYEIDGLCMYHYWFENGKQILEKPAENLLQWTDIDMPFCFCWANETWARTWSKISANVWSSKFEDKGSDMKNAILLQQNYGEDKQWKEHFEYLLPFFKDERYIKIENKPLFMIYKPLDIECLEDMCGMWKKWAKEEGLDGIFFVAASDYKLETKNIDAHYSHQPRKTIEKLLRNMVIKEWPVKFDYDVIWRAILSDVADNDNTYFGGFVDFDTTPRSGENGIVTYGACPNRFKNYLTELMAKNEAYGKDITFINAWNEWGEGMYVEPDEKNGYAYLEAVRYAKKHYEEHVLHYIKKKELNVCGMWEGYDLLVKRARQSLARSRTFDKWLTMMENGRYIGEYLKEKNITSIAIYGMGRFGRHLLSDLKRCDVEVKYVIDRRADIKNVGCPIYDIDNAPINTDTVLVTLVDEYETVVQKLKEKGFENILLLMDLIDERSKSDI